MNKFIDELKEKKIISKGDIETLKNYINKKYAESKSSERASMLSNTVHNILYSKLEGIPDVYKTSIKATTLKNTFLQNKTSITLYDIFNSCLAENDLKLTSISLLTTWVNLHVNNKIDEKDLKSCFENNKEDNSTNILESNPVDSISLQGFKFTRKHIIACILIFFIVAMYPINKLLNYSTSYTNSLKLYSYNEPKNLEPSLEIVKNKFPNSHLPDYIRYKKINEPALKDFLLKHKSLLAKEPYFSTMLSTAKDFNLNPLLLFAITGQEQDFVPENSKNASKIANNPFNVFHSWKEYNTDINDSSKIASRTIINLCKEMPKDENPFLWIGKKYAEDNNWGKGVQAIFKNLNQKCQ